MEDGYVASATVCHVYFEVRINILVSESPEGKKEREAWINI